MNFYQACQTGILLPLDSITIYQRYHGQRIIERYHPEILSQLQNIFVAYPSSIIKKALKNRQWEFVNFIHETIPDREEFHQVIFNNEFKNLDEILQRYPLNNVEYREVLRDAILYQNIKTVKLLIHHGVEYDNFTVHRILKSKKLTLYLMDTTSLIDYINRMQLVVLLSQDKYKVWERILKHPKFVPNPGLLSIFLCISMKEGVRNSRILRLLIQVCKEFLYNDGIICKILKHREKFPDLWKILISDLDVFESQYCDIKHLSEVEKFTKTFPVPVETYFGCSGLQRLILQKLLLQHF